jgi:hypothetical protein
MVKLPFGRLINLNGREFGLKNIKRVRKMDF